MLLVDNGCQYQNLHGKLEVRAQRLRVRRIKRNVARNSTKKIAKEYLPNIRDVEIISYKTLLSSH